MTAGARHIDRLLELMADEAAEGLDATATRELESLLDESPGVRRDELMETAALVQLACLKRTSTMPRGLQERLAAQAVAVLPGPAPADRPAAVVAPLGEARSRRRPEARGVGRGPAHEGQGRRPAWAIYGGWAAAAALAIALVLARGPSAPEAGRDSRATLLAGATDVVVLPWSMPTARGFENVRGDVVWSDQRQQGYLRLAGMPVNDPARTQYQLWIVDPERDDHPVDGGVFDVNSTGEVIIPITARLRVDDPKAFAITEEKPGGVVVSAGPLLVVAASS